MPGVTCLAAIAPLIAALSACLPRTARQSVEERPKYGIRVARILDPGTGDYSEPAVVRVSAGRIVDVVAATRFVSSSVDSVVDLSALTLLPGLIDSHVHLTIGNGFRRNAMADLQAGFTTVVDLGAVSLRLLRLRDSVRAGLITGPQILAAGLWIGVKGGTCEFTGIGVAGGPAEFRARVLENVNAGPMSSRSACQDGWLKRTPSRRNTRCQTK